MKRVEEDELRAEFHEDDGSGLLGVVERARGTEERGIKERGMKPEPIDPWENDAVQFPRLLAEIAATQGALDMESIAESMDITVEEVNELFERADIAWENIKYFQELADAPDIKELFGPVNVKEFSNGPPRMGEATADIGEIIDAWDSKYQPREGGVMSDPGGTTTVVVLSDGETYSNVIGAVTMEVPEHIEDIDKYVRERASLEEPVVPMSDLLDSVRLAMRSNGIGQYADDVLADVEDYVTNHYGVE